MDTQTKNTLGTNTAFFIYAIAALFIMYVLFCPNRKMLDDYSFINTTKNQKIIDSLLDKNDYLELTISANLIKNKRELDSVINSKKTEYKETQITNKEEIKKVKNYTKTEVTESMIKRYGSEGVKVIDTNKISVTDTVTKRIVLDFTERDQFHKDKISLEFQLETQEKRNSVSDSLIYTKNEENANYKKVTKLLGENNLKLESDKIGLKEVNKQTKKQNLLLKIGVVVLAGLTGYQIITN